MSPLYHLLPVVLLGLSPALSLADEGGSGGNGGQSVICRDVESGEYRVDAFDTFEGTFLFGHDYARSPRHSTALGLALELAARVDAVTASPIRLTERVRRVAAAILASRAHPELPLTRDIAPLYLPRSCELVQTLVFEKDETIKVNKLAWGRLDLLGQAALYLHEAVYWHLRDVRGEADSRRTRRIVSFLLNGGDLRNAPDALGAFDPTPVYCTSRGGIRRGGRFGLFLVVEPDGRLSLLKEGRYRGQLFPVRLAGSLPGAALVTGGLFRPSGSAVFSGTTGDLSSSVRLTLAATTARVEVTATDGTRRDAGLHCRPYRALLP